MKEIQLGQQGKNKGKYVALVDDEDFERVNQFKWNISIESYITYVRGWVRKDGRRVRVRLHRFILEIENPNILIDHSDHNGLNCQRYNLRPCTNSQNMMNLKKYKKCSSKYKGVSFDNRINKFVSKITINYKPMYLGWFSNEIEAAKTYDKKAIELFGEFAHLNFNKKAEYPVIPS